MKKTGLKKEVVAKLDNESMDLIQENDITYSLESNYADSVSCCNVRRNKSCFYIDLGTACYITSSRKCGRHVLFAIKT